MREKRNLLDKLDLQRDLQERNGIYQKEAIFTSEKQDSHIDQCARSMTNMYFHAIVDVIKMSKFILFKK